MPIDVAFLGSSHTMCGINDSIVQKTLENNGKHFEISNLGYCRLGRDMEYVIFKDLLKHKKPKLLVLEVRQEEPELGHPDFGYMADISDILHAPVIINRSIVGALINAYTVRLNYTKDILCRKDWNTHYEAPPLTFFHKNVIADTSVLYTAARNRWERYYKHTRPAWQDKLMTRYPKSYINMIAELAKTNHVKIVMLYIPNFGYPFHKPKELDYYKQIADIILMPDSFYDNDKNWMDDEHLNSSAAIMLSDSVGHYIATHLN